MSELTDVDLLELDIDLRLRALWEQLESDGDEEMFTLQEIGLYMRAAYGSGYLHALQEDVRGKLCIDHGYPVPRRN